MPGQEQTIGGQCLPAERERMRVELWPCRHRRCWKDPSDETTNRSPSKVVNELFTTLGETTEGNYLWSGWVQIDLQGNIQATQANLNFGEMGSIFRRTCVPAVAWNRLAAMPVCLIRMLAGILSWYRWRACLPALLKLNEGAMPWEHRRESFNSNLAATLVESSSCLGNHEDSSWE